MLSQCFLSCYFWGLASCALKLVLELQPRPERPRQQPSQPGAKGTPRPCQTRPKQRNAASVCRRAASPRRSCSPSRLVTNTTRNPQPFPFPCQVPGRPFASYVQRPQQLNAPPLFRCLTNSRPRALCPDCR